MNNQRKQDAGIIEQIIKEAFVAPTVTMQCPNKNQRKQDVTILEQIIRGNLRHSQYYNNFRIQQCNYIRSMECPN